VQQQFQAGGQQGQQQQQGQQNQLQ